MESDSTHSTHSSHSTHSPEAGNEIVAAEASEQPGVDEHTGEAPSPSPTAATRSSKHKGKKKVVSSVKRKREKKMKAERSSVWEHFTKFDKPLVEIVDGKETVVSNTKRAQCKYCPTHLACDSRENGTSLLRKHIELVCKGYPGRNNLEESQQILSSDVFDQKSTLVSRQWSEEACLDAACVMIILDELPFSAIERPGFRHFCKVAVPRWDVPCRKVGVKKFLRMYDTKKETLKR
ncbi:uncharacterized protein LOC112203758 [Rosa chinensis]|uniref:uncharacterized protein LOC112203758 n=1 Tax=Rosa chinensis TaxID=74649 RepID=UPI000D088D4E|nr:uncharacterized protein LOC112203758 [Rosa chinensis]